MSDVNPHFMRPAPQSVTLTVGSPWGERDGHLHQGIDIAMPEGTPLYALADGEIIRVQPNIDPAAGRWVGVRYGNGMVSRHLHMSRVADVAVGDRVKQGDVIGWSGNTGRSSGPHLHLALHAPKELLPAIEQAVGKPTAGWGPDSQYGTAIPAEPWVPVDGYRATTLVKLMQRGIPTYVSLARWTPTQTKGAVVIGALGLALIGVGVAFGRYRKRKRRVAAGLEGSRVPPPGDPIDSVELEGARKPKPDLMPVAVNEHDKHFATGQPVTFAFVRSTEKSPNFGARYQQDIEPAGRYMLHSPHTPPPGWERGTVTFKSPLVLAFHPDEIAYDAQSWKARLQQIYGKRGIALSRALKRDGYDGIVTVALENGRPADTREIIDLTQIRGARGLAGAELGDVAGPDDWWRTNPRLPDKMCYATKQDALNVFRNENQDTIGNWGGLDAKARPSDFDAVNHKYGVKADTLSKAIWAAMPARRPFCLENIDIAALNDTAPGRAVAFRLPSWVHEHGYDDAQAEHYRTRDVVEHEERPAAAKTLPNGVTKRYDNRRAFDKDCGKRARRADVGCTLVEMEETDEGGAIATVKVQPGRPVKPGTWRVFDESWTSLRRYLDGRAVDMTSTNASKSETPF